MKQSEKLTQLLELMQANPELPVIPCVDGDEDFSIGQDGMFYDNKYTEDG